MSIRANASNSTGDATVVTGNGAPAKVVKRATGEPGKSRKTTSRSAASNLPATADVLRLLQEDLRLLQAAGVKIVAIPVPDGLGIALFGVRLEDGDFTMDEVKHDPTT